MSETLYLYRFEAKGLQQFIFQTNRLREIKGGSLLIEQLGELLRVAHAALPGEGGDEQPMVAAGGATIVFQTRARAEAFVATWPVIVSRYVPGLQVVQAFVALDGEDAWGRLQRALHVERQRLEVVLPEVGPQILRAARTGLPAQQRARSEEADLPRELQDKGLARRARCGHDSRRDPVGERIAPGQQWAFELGELGVSYAAIVHIDGNDLGDRLRRLAQVESGEPVERIVERLMCFSEALSEVTELAARAGYEAIVRSYDRSGVLPARPVVLGGDDITMILRASDAMGFTRAYLQCFERESEARAEVLGGALSACAGIAFAQTTYPFDRACVLAEELCAFSKSRLRGAGAQRQTPSALAFHRVTTSATGSYAEILDTELRGEDAAHMLTAGPYTLEPVEGYATIQNLQALTGAICGLPHGPTREVLSLMKFATDRAALRWRRLGEVSKDSAASHRSWGEVIQTLELMGCDEGGWRTERAGGQRTPLLDAWSLFVSEGKQEREQQVGELADMRGDCL